MDIFHVEPTENRNIEIYIRKISENKPQSKKEIMQDSNQKFVFENYNQKTHNDYSESVQESSRVFCEQNYRYNQCEEENKFALNSDCIGVGPPIEDEDRRKNYLFKSISADEANLKSIKESLISLDFSWRSLQGNHLFEQRDGNGRGEHRASNFMNIKNPSCLDNNFRKSIDNPYGMKTLRNNFLIDVNE